MIRRIHAHVSGFHLACDATNERAVHRLRLLKGREERPLAIMAAGVEEARGFVAISEDERAWLEGPESPIVLLAKKTPCGIAESVAPGNRYLYSALGEDWTERRIPMREGIAAGTWQVLKRMMDRGVNSPLCSSAGRMFDAVAALIGLRDRVSYEGQAAIELEQIASEREDLAAYSFEVKRGERGKCREISVLPMFGQIVEDLERAVPGAVVSRRFHETCALFMAQECARIGEESGIAQVCVGGGTFQNVLLLGRLKEHLANRGLALFWPRLVPPNDGGIALGQAVIASEILALASGRS